MNDLLIFLAFNRRVLGIEGADALAAAEIRNTNAGKHAAGDLIGRKCARASQDNAGQSRRTQQFPYRDTVASIHDRGPDKYVPWWLEPIECDFRSISHRISTDEVKNTV